MEDPNVFEWMAEARVTQNNLCNLFGRKEYDEVPNNLELEKKIRVAIFGYGENNNLEYEEKEMCIVREIADQIHSQSNNGNGKFYLNVTYILIKVVATGEKYLQLVFRIGVKKNKEIENCCFIDTLSRVYSDWEDFMNSNTLPPCSMCFPEDGKYIKSSDGTCKIKFKQSYTSVCAKVANIAPIASSIIGLSVLGLSLVVPVTLPIVIGAEIISCAGSVVAASKHAVDLYDKHAHKQSISPLNEEGRQAWFSLLTSSAGALASGANVVAKVSNTFKSANVARIINISSFCIAGVNVINGIADILIKCINGQLSKDDLLKFALSCLYLFNAYISLEMAERLIQEITFNHPNTIGLCGSYVKTVAVCTWTEVTCLSVEYYDLLAGFIGVSIVSLNLGRISTVIYEIGDQINALRNGDITLKQFIINVGYHLVTILDEYKDIIKEAFDYIQKWIFNFNPMIKSSHYKEINGNIVPNIINIEVLHEITTLIRRTAQYVSSCEDDIESVYRKQKKIMRLMKEFDSLKPAANNCEFGYKLAFFCEHFKDKYLRLKDEYEHDLDVAFEIDCDLNEEHFKTSKGISGNVIDYFFDKARQFTSYEYEALQKKYNEFTKDKSFSNSYFRDCKFSKVYTFCYSPKTRINLAENLYPYASEFAEVEINSENSKVEKGPGDCVILDPQPGHNVPRVYFNIPTDYEYNFGIAIVEKM